MTRFSEKIPLRHSWL